MRPSGWSYDFRIGATGASGADFYIGQNHDASTHARDNSSYATNYIRMNASDGTIRFGTGATNAIPAERIIIKNDGKTGINNTNPQTTLNVKGTISTGRNVAREVGTATASVNFNSNRDGENVINGKKN